MLRVEQAARLGFSVLYTRAPRLLQELHAAPLDPELCKSLIPSAAAVCDNWKSEKGEVLTND